MTNAGGIRADLTVEPGRAVTVSDLSAIQPFGNQLVVLTISGAQLHELLRRQLAVRAGPALLQVSNNLRYQWSQAAGADALLGAVSVDGQPLDRARDYRVVVNSFMADGGNDLSILRQGRERLEIGMDIDALVEWLSENPVAMDQIESGRIRRN